MFDLYVLVDNERREILTPINKIPEDWSNINGLNLFDDEKLNSISEKLMMIGFSSVEVDPEGYKQGKINVIAD